MFFPPLVILIRQTGRICLTHPAHEMVFIPHVVPEAKNYRDRLPANFGDNSILEQSLYAVGADIYKRSGGRSRFSVGKIERTEVVIAKDDTFRVAGVVTAVPFA